MPTATRDRDTLILRAPDRRTPAQAAALARRELDPSRRPLVPTPRGPPAEPGRPPPGGAWHHAAAPCPLCCALGGQDPGA
jgi:hypothetical protein